MVRWGGARHRGALGADGSVAHSVTRVLLEVLGLSKEESWEEAFA